MKLRHLLSLFAVILVVSLSAVAQPYDFQFKSIVNDSTLGYNRIRTSYGLATDRQGKIYVTSYYSHNILMYTTDGINFTSCGQFGSKGTGNGQFDSPQDLAIDSTGLVYVCDRANSRIQVFSITGTSLTFVAKFGSYGTADDQFYSPNGIATDGKGKIYVTDMNFQDIKVLTLSGNNIGYYTKFRNTSTTVSSVGIPNDVAVNKNGEIFVGSYNYIQVFTASGTNYTEVARTGGDGQAAYKFKGAYRLAFTSSGELIVGENQNQRIQAYQYNSANKQFIYLQMQYWLTNALSINAVYGLGVDINNRILITSSSNGIPHSISMFTLSGSNLSPVCLGFNDELGQVNSGSPMAFDSKRNLLYHASTGSYYFQAYSVTGQNILPFAKGIGINTPTNLKFFPEDIHADTLGNIYVMNNSYLEIYTISGKSFVLVARTTTSAGYSLDLDPSTGVIYVRDFSGSKLTKFNWDGNTLTTTGQIVTSAIRENFHIDGRGRFYSQSSNTSSSPINIYTVDGTNMVFVRQLPSPASVAGQFYNPKNVFSDDLGLIYVTDWFNGNLYIYSVSGTNYTHVQTNSLIGTSIARITSLDGIQVTSKGQVFLVDAGTNKIVSYQRVNSSPVTSLESATLPESTSVSTLRAYPNPIEGNTLYLEGVPTGSSMVWSDAVGNVLFSSYYNTKGMDVSGFQPGVYLLSGTSDTQTFSFKIIVK